MEKNKPGEEKEATPQGAVGIGNGFDIGTSGLQVLQGCSSVAALS